MEYKLDYISRLFSKISHKRTESYVINRLWNKLDDTRIQFVLQQYVLRKEGKYALADVYLPQLKLSVEVNEPYHYGNIESDKIRNAELAEYMEVKHINCYNVVDGKVVDCSLEEVNQRTDEVAAYIKQRIAELGNDFHPWKNTDTLADIQERGYLSVKDEVSLYTIDDIAAVFGTRPKHRGFLRASGVAVPNKPDEVVWWPNTSHRKWENSLQKDGVTITECPRNESERAAHVRQHIGSNEKRIVFLRYTDILGLTSYRFMGVYQMNKEKSVKENKCVWERISETYVLDNKTYKI